jgi:hypothetical protein
MPEQLQPGAASAFLAILPVIRSVARLRVRHLRCLDQRDDVICEVVAVAWKWHLGLFARGRNPADFTVPFAQLAVRAVVCGRRLCGRAPVRDVMSGSCQRRHGFLVAMFPHGPAWPDAFTDALADNTRSPVPDQAQFRIDFADWVRRLPPRRRRVLERLAAGHRTSEVARTFGVSPARIAQIRGALRRDYLRFLREPAGD